MENNNNHNHDYVSAKELDKAMTQFRNEVKVSLDGKLSIGEFERRHSALESIMSRQTDRVDAIVDRVTKVEYKVDEIADKVNDMDKTLTVLVTRFDGFVREVTNAGRRNLVILGIVVSAVVGVLQLLHL